MRPFVAPLRRSPRLLAALLAAYAAAWLAISQLPLAPALLAVALSGLALWRGLRQQGWLGAPLPQLEVSARGELIAHWPSHAEQVGVRADSLALPWLIVLKLNTQRGRLALLLTVDSAPADALRRLRVYLRWAQPTTVA
ncbi:MAG: protein YgfX [Rivihabitans pingtungensis]|uniref:protein YgfX n=1 Tax=Rivihabitans pingtungensis TaxID=1054498 RepID=UPI0028967972|nr:protein YgfX [Rivihabitans pingtungensis]